jgi:guanylate kinase
METNSNQRIFVYTGPEGSGRKTVAELAGSTFAMKKIIAYTTRQRRINEIDGQDYHYVTHEQFIAAKANGEFVETVQIHENQYGIKSADINRFLESHGSIYLVLNRHGADLVKEAYGDKVIRLFIYADRDTVKQRQIDRGLEEQTIQRNITKFNEDMAYMSRCEHAFENYDLSHTVFDITRTVEGYLNRQLLDLD